jgi:membrane-bound metal-dependent hydrolase YbcI (DUF457 family)
VLAIAAAILPDADALLLLAAPHAAIGHRGLSHSLLFAASAIVAGVLTRVAFLYN